MKNGPPVLKAHTKVQFIPGARRCLTELHPKFSLIDVSAVVADKPVLCMCVAAAL